MNNKAIIGLISSIVLFLGLFLPLQHNPFTGTQNYFTFSGLDGALILVCSISAFVFAISKKTKFLIIPGGISTIILFVFYVSWQSRFSIASDLMKGDTYVLNQFSGLLYGFYFMFISSLILTIIGFISLRDKKQG